MQGSFFRKITYTEGIYPVLRIEQIKNPNRFYAVPIVGILVKILLLIPIAIEISLLFIWLLIVVLLINPFVVLLTGKYWQHVHNFSLGLFRLMTKSTFFLYGLTDKYPWFDFKTTENLSLEISLNKNPKKLYAVPILGGVIRMILLIPYFIFANIVSQAALIGVFILAWAIVLFKGKYPAGIFELARDATRVSLGSWSYMMGLSDRYPSFYISMIHDKIKIILIAIAIIFNGFNFASNKDSGPNKTDFQMEQNIPFYDREI